MLQTDLIKLRFLAFLTTGLMISAFLLNSFQPCIAEKFFPQYRTHLISLTQSHFTGHEINDCAHPQVEVCGIFSSMTSNNNLAPKKDSPLPFLSVLLVLMMSNAMGRRILLSIPPESKFFYKNPILFKLSKVRLLI